MKKIKSYSFFILEKYNFINEEKLINIKNYDGVTVPVYLNPSPEEMELLLKSKKVLRGIIDDKFNLYLTYDYHHIELIYELQSKGYINTNFNFTNKTLKEKTEEVLTNMKELCKITLISLINNYFSYAQTYPIGITLRKDITLANMNKVNGFKNKYKELYNKSFPIGFIYGKVRSKEEEEIHNKNQEKATVFQSDMKKDENVE